MVQTSYEVPVVEQGAENPICWVACLAMVESYMREESIGVGWFTDGFDGSSDPSQACIGNPAVDVVDFQNRLQAFHFYPVFDDEPLTMDALSRYSQKFGPLVYFHRVEGFPYSQGMGQGAGSHAIVITGTDTEADGFWFNNPWGDKDSWADATHGLAAAADPESSSFSLYFRASD